MAALSADPELDVFFSLVLDPDDDSFVDESEDPDESDDPDSDELEEPDELDDAGLRESVT